MLSNTDVSGEYEEEEDEKKKEKKIKKVVRCLQIVIILGRLQPQIVKSSQIQQQNWFLSVFSQAIFICKLLLKHNQE